MPDVVWRETKTGNLYHDGCFDEGEGREGFTEVPLNSLDSDDDCSGCNNSFVEDDDDEDDDDPDDKEDDD